MQMGVKGGKEISGRLLDDINFMIEVRRQGDQKRVKKIWERTQVGRPSIKCLPYVLIYFF